MEKKQILAIVAANIVRLMKEKKIKDNAELARRSNIATGTISKILQTSMNISLELVVKLATGLDASVHEVLEGIDIKKIDKVLKKQELSKSEQLCIGILSINNKRVTCVKSPEGKILGSIELEGGLDLTETSGSLLSLIQEAIHKALPDDQDIDGKLEQTCLNLVTQSFEFEDTRIKFVNFAKKYFKDVILLPDWQLTYFADFKDMHGISLVIDKGVSLSYMTDGKLKKLGGWKFPVYDLGGENWLGVETIRHTIEAVEGYIPMTALARNVMSKFGGKIEKITETCFKGAHPDIYCTFTESLLRSYFTGEPTAKVIIERGFEFIYKLVDRADAILGKQLKIAINGSLADIYKVFFKPERLISPSSDTEKGCLLADITRDFLMAHGIKDIVNVT